jgi:hypothetical protein
VALHQPDGRSRLVWAVLVAIAIGGVSGFFAYLDHTTDPDPAAGAGTALAYAVLGSGALSFAAIIALTIARPEWWWRWGLMLSWGYLLMAVSGIATYSDPFNATAVMLVLASASIALAKVVAVAREPRVTEPSRGAVSARRRHL